MEKVMKLPNFLVVGAHKSGTTSLYNYLKQHKEIYLSDRKEGLFFSDIKPFEGIGSEQYNKTLLKDFNEYKKLFENVNNEKAIGDVSPDYLYFYENSIKNIKKYLGDNVKIIIILRNPIERAYSNYTFYVKLNLENLSFWEALQKEEERKKANMRWAFRYKEIGLYYNQVKSYKESFREVMIIDFDEFKNNRKQVVKNICRFLEVDDDINYINFNEIYNKSGIPKNKLLHKFLTTDNLVKNSLIKISKPIFSLFIDEKNRKEFVELLINNNLEKKEMSKKEKEYFINYYKEDILKLNEIVEFDTTKWLKV
jgi:hypothetical protein